MQLLLVATIPALAWMLRPPTGAGRTPSRGPGPQRHAEAIAALYGDTVVYRPQRSPAGPEMPTGTVTATGKSGGACYHNGPQSLGWLCLGSDT